MAVARYLVDKSALARLSHASVAARLSPLLESGLVATCTLIDLEILYSTRSPSEYVAVLEERQGFERLDIDQADWTRAQQVQAQLARRSQLRAVGIADLVLAALAERHRVVLMHYDRDFDTVAALTGQPAQWVVPAGSVP